MTLEELKIIEDSLKLRRRPGNETPDYYQACEILNREIVLKETDFVKKELPDRPQNVKCPDCGGDMVPRQSQHGKFWGCKQYPKCKGTRDSLGRSKADRESERRKSDLDTEWTGDTDSDHEDIGPDNSQYRWKR